MKVAGSDAVGPIDRAFLALARYHQPTTGFLLDFAGPVPERAALAERVVRRAAGLPALNLLRPVGRARSWRRRRTELAPEVHVRWRQGLRGAAELAAATDELLSRPLPGAEHPPWDVWVLGLDADAEAGTGVGVDVGVRVGTGAGSGAGTSTGVGFRVLLRVHHAVQDGVGAAHSALALFGDEPAAGPHLYPAGPPTVSGALLAAADAARQLRAYGGPRDWPELRVSPTGRTGWVGRDVPLTRLRELADAAGTSVNDVALAGLAGALRDWHGGGAAAGRSELPVVVAMSTRGPAERYAPGNHVVGHRLVLPTSAGRLPDALAAVRRQTDAVRRTHTRDVRRLLVRMLPHRAGELAMTVVKNAVPIGASSVTVADTLHCLGAPLTGASMIYDVHDGLLGYVSFTRAAEVLRCGLVYDTALPRAAELPGLWQRVVGAA